MNELESGDLSVIVISLRGEIKNCIGEISRWTQLSKEGHDKEECEKQIKFWEREAKINERVLTKVNIEMRKVIWQLQQ